MIPTVVSSTRQKAVWGPKRTLAAVFTLTLAVSATAFAAPGHNGRKARPGKPNSLVENYKVDRELSYRSKYRAASEKTSVIVELKSGAQVPAEFRQFKRRNGQLRIINGQVLELPNRMIAQMAKHPDVFRLHFNRPTVSQNYRTALTT